MRFLIDGYNLMHARGLMAPRFGPNGFRKARRRFLNDLAAALDPVEAHQTTVVFDADGPPEHLPKEGRHQGLTVLFAVDDEDADTRIERLIASHPDPKRLTVVSSDHRIRQAASRRRARVLTADEYLVRLMSPGRSRPAVAHDQGSRRDGPTPSETEHWLAEFGHLDDDPEFQPVVKPDPLVPSAEELARIEREVEAEQ